VLIQLGTKEVPQYIKTLTTKTGHSVASLAALNELMPDDPSLSKLVVISTTLGTCQAGQKLTGL